MNAASARAGPHHPRAGPGSSEGLAFVSASRPSLLFLSIAVSLYQASAAFPTAAEGTLGVSDTRGMSSNEQLTLFSTY